MDPEKLHFDENFRDDDQVGGMPHAVLCMLCHRKVGSWKMNPFDARLDVACVSCQKDKLIAYYVETRNDYVKELMRVLGDIKKNEQYLEEMDLTEPVVGIYGVGYVWNNKSDKIVDAVSFLKRGIRWGDDKAQNEKAMEELKAWRKQQ